MKQKLLDLIKKHEGFRGQPYFDSVGKLTVGYGRNITDIGFSDEEIKLLNLDFGRSLTVDPLLEEEAEFLLKNDIKIAEAESIKLISNFNNLNEARQAVIVNMMFNLGFCRLSKFKKTLSYIYKEEFEKASVEMLDSKWSKQVKSRAIELSKMMRTGEFLC